MVLDFKDEVLCANLNHIISGLLPHDNYDVKSFSLLYPTLQTVLPENSIRGIYYVFYQIFNKYFSLQNNFNEDEFVVRITRERFENALVNNLPDFILEPNLRVSEIMNEEGKSGDITIPTIQNEAMSIVFAKAMDLYDICFEESKSCEDAMAYLVDLKDSIKANVIETGLQMQRAIMSVGLTYGHKFYRGTSGWLDFSQQLVKEVSEIDANTKDDLVCNTLDILPAVETQTTQMSEGLAGYGIPQLDDKTPMLCNRLAVFVAKENTGKTKVITHLIASLIRAGVKPYFACGEAQPQAMFMRIVSSYIFQEYGLYFEPDDLYGKGFEVLDTEDRQVVQTAKARVSMSGVIINNSLEYDNVLPAFISAYNQGCRAFFVDHTQSLRGRKGRRIGELVTSLALDCREFKNNYPVYVCLSSQPSTNMKDILQKEQTKDIQQSPTAQSATPSQEADELFILSDNDYLSKQNLLQWIVFKRRDAPKPAPFYIRKLFHVSAYQYDPSVQGGESIDAEELEGLITSAVGVSMNKDDEDDVSDLQIDW